MVRRLVFPLTLISFLAVAGGCSSSATSSDGAGSGARPGTGGQATGGTISTGGQTTGGSPSSGGQAAGGQGTGGTDPGIDAPTAQQAAAAMGRGFNLGQMFENTQHPRTFEAASAKIDAYYARGFRNMRIPITWTDVVDGTTLVHDPLVGEVNRQHPRLAVIEQIVDYALSKPDLYVVVNAHHERALKTNAQSAVLERLWQDIADIFQNRSHHLLFEILNEPHKEDEAKGPMAPADLRHMTGLAYRKIRAVDSKRIVIIGGNQWFGAHEVPAVWTDLTEVGGGSDAYVMATFHHYDPWTFCGDNQGDYADAWAATNISEPMETMQAWAETVGGGMPIYIGEWGAGWGSRYSTLTCNNVRKWYADFGQTAASKEQPTAVWDDGGWFKVFDHGTGDFANNLVDCMTDGVCAWDGDERFNEGCQ